MRINRLFFFSSVTISHLESVKYGDGSPFSPPKWFVLLSLCGVDKAECPFLSLLIVFLVLRMKTDGADLKYDFLLRESDIIHYICGMLAL